MFRPPPITNRMASEPDYHLNDGNEILRPIADFPESIWIDRFKPFTLDKQVYDMYVKEIEILKEEVRSTLLATENKTVEKLSFIDTLEQLGVSYHFEKEIDHLLGDIFNQNANLKDYPQCDLYTAALQFRLFRQHGFNISCGISYQFTDANNKFNESLSNDIKGLLSLYEASHVRTHQDKILEEALTFTTTHLKCGAQSMTSSLARQVKHALEQALHNGIPRIETRQYISIYEEDESKNHLLLRLANLDYHLLQMLHREELNEILRWGKDLEIVSKVPYSRNRLVECYFWALGVFFEPQYSFSRIIFAKTSVLLTIVDDTYDAYGTIDELKAFRDALEGWDVTEINQLPDYMKTSYVALLDFCGWLEQELTTRGRSYAFSKYKEEWKQYVRTSYTQSYWFLTRELPKFSDYLKNALITSAYYLLTPTALLVMESATKHVFDWLSKKPKILVASCKIGRLVNDVGSYEVEKQRAATGLECYMQHYKVDEEEAMKKFEKMGEDAWKDINEEFLRPTAVVPREILMRVLNLARIIDVVYKHREDGFTNPHKVIEPHIVAVLLDPIAF